MPRAQVSPSIDLEYEVFGDAGAPPIVLVMGFAMQMIAWDEEFCRELASRGFRVVRFDNRDVGLSTKRRDLGPPDLVRVMVGDPGGARYAIRDMANDVAGLVAALDIAPVHLVGASMGGFIAQEAVITHPAKVRSLCSIMSTTGQSLILGLLDCIVNR